MSQSNKVYPGLIIWKEINVIHNINKLIKTKHIIISKDPEKRSSPPNQHPFMIKNSQENSTETSILPYVKQITSPSSMHKTGHSKPMHGDNPEGWDGEGGGGGHGSGRGTHVHPWLIHVNVWQKPPQYCKVISLQLK